MLGDIFYWLFNMSIVASLSGAVILLFRRVRRIPRRLIALLWAIPCIRMWIPFGIGGRYGLMSLLNSFRYRSRTVCIYRSGDRAVVTMSNSARATVDGIIPLTYREDLLRDLFRVAGIVWAAVFALLLLLIVILYFSALRDLRGAVRLRENIYLSDRVTSPAVYGIFRPKIVLPASTPEADYPMILAHETAHVRRGDNLFRLIAFLSVALHWFNPLAWVFLRCYLSDAEEACDERVLSKLDEEGRRDYARCLLNQAERRAAFPAAFGGAKLRDRVKRIVSYENLTFFSILGCALLAAALTYFLLTNAL
ncbi:MAG: M56 family metallopeptidase [Clostridia bacterium]|nr:M56 family metallopeptidase [Clostridia bacterium]